MASTRVLLLRNHGVVRRFARALATGEKSSSSQIRVNPESTVSEILALKRGNLSDQELRTYLHQQEPLWTVRFDQTIYEAMCTMLDAGVGALIVTKNRKVCGIVTDRDMLKFSRRLQEGLPNVNVNDAKHVPVSFIMTPSEQVVCVSPHDSQQEAVNIMAARTIRHLPVIDWAEKKLVGVLSLRDLLPIAADPAMVRRYGSSERPAGLRFLSEARKGPETENSPEK